MLSSSEKAIKQPGPVPPGSPLRRWLIVIAVTLIWLYIGLGVAWFTGGLRPWVYEWLG